MQGCHVLGTWMRGATVPVMPCSLIGTARLGAVVCARTKLNEQRHEERAVAVRHVFKNCRRQRRPHAVHQQTGVPATVFSTFPYHRHCNDCRLVCFYLRQAVQRVASGPVPMHSIRACLGVHWVGRARGDDPCCVRPGRTAVVATLILIAVRTAEQHERRRD